MICGGRGSHETFTNGAGKTVTCQYNGVGLVSRLTTPGSLNFDYTYNALNQLSSVLNPNGVTVSFSYDNGGRLSRITRPGSYIDYQYNARDWITAVLNRTTGGATRYDASYYYNDGALWDHTGNPLKRTENWGSGAWTTTLRYDNVYRLTEEALRDSGGVLQHTHTYGYDQVGNRTLRNDGGTRSLGHYYDANDKLLTTRWVGGGPPGPINANFYYDGAGNMTSVTGTEFGAWTMTYDDESRLKTVTSPAGTESFVYNALGQRMKLTVGTAVARYIYDGDRVLEETDNAGTVLARYTTAAGSYYAPLLHMYRTSGSLSRFPMFDLTGNVCGLLDAGGAVTDAYSLELFGKQRSSTGSTPNPYRFGGAWGYINGGSGLQQLGARFYWPDIGRFIQQDPIGDGMNWYAYVANRPVVAVDPAGLDAFWEDVVDSQNAFFKCMLDELALNDVRDADRALRRIARGLVGAGVIYGSGKGAAGCQANASRARELQVAFQDLERARGNMEFAGSATTKGWSQRAAAWARRAKPLKWIGKWAGRASGIFLAWQVGAAYSKCFGKLTF